MTTPESTLPETAAFEGARALSVIILGGGASAVYSTVALVEKAKAEGLPAPTITVVEREATVGLGIAYGRAEAHHLLNSPVGKMSLSGTDDAWFLRWCQERGVDVTPGSFVPRRLFGEYVVETFAGIVAESDGRISHVEADANGVDVSESGVAVTLADGTTLSADVLILAVGNPPPGTWSTAADRVIQDPWAVGALDGVSDRDRVLLIGTGLTMVDVATTLARRHPKIRLTATSRNLLVPRNHLSAPAAPGPGVDDNLTSLGDLISAVGRQVRSAKAAGEPWQAVIDGMRPQLNPIWARLSLADRRRFLSHVARFWDVHRHRMAPTVSAELSGLFDSGTLALAAGTAQTDITQTDFDVVINCTGPRAVGTAGWNPLIDSLLDAGLVKADPLGLGLDALPSGALIGANDQPSERMFAIGSALRGPIWETVAVAEIRQEATALAAGLLGVHSFA